MWRNTSMWLLVIVNQQLYLCLSITYLVSDNISSLGRSFQYCSPLFLTPVASYDHVIRIYPSVENRL